MATQRHALSGKAPRPPRDPQSSAATVRADFTDPVAVVHYARAAHFLGLRESERMLIAKTE